MKHSLLYIILIMFETSASPSWAQVASYSSVLDAIALLPPGVRPGLPASSVSSMQFTPLDYPFFIARGQYRSQQNDFAGAIADFNKALQLHPHDVQALAGRGYAYYHTNRYKAALIDYNQCLRLAPTNADVYYKRGLLKAKLHEIDAAILDFNKVLALAPRHYLALMARGYCQSYLSGDGLDPAHMDEAMAVMH
jgi:tetratricopeptide (TPR) repeat protein